MITIIRGAEVYSPEHLGIKDVLIIGNKIAQISRDISVDLAGVVDVIEIDGTGKILTPGFIDSHVHILGGGGEGGFTTRTPEINLTDLTTAGVTTVVGCLGTDGLTRDMISLLAKARALEEEGITSYIYTGSYRMPVKTITGEVMKDIIVVDKIIGIGEVAISDHRSSHPTFNEFSRDVSDIRVGGMLSGKAGIVNIHLGGGRDRLSLLDKIIKDTEIPISQFLPTHINRNKELFNSCLEYAKKGGYIDFTGSEDPKYWEDLDGEVRFSRGLKMLIEEGVSMDNFTVSSDGQGSLPLFNEDKELIGLKVGKPKALIVSIKEAVFKEEIPIEIALRAVTSNPAKILKLKNKGRIEKGMDGDLCLLDAETLDIEVVIAKGKIMVENSSPLVFGTFEKNVN